MPIYEYRCTGCGEEFEKLVLQRDAPDPPCPACSADQVQRLISRLGLAGTAPVTGDALFDSDKLTFTQRQGLKGRVPQAAKQAYKAMRAERQAAGQELGHSHELSAEELAELDPDDPRRLEAGHYHDPDHVHLVDDAAAEPHSQDHSHDHGHPHDHDHAHEAEAPEPGPAAGSVGTAG